MYVWSADDNFRRATAGTARGAASRRRPEGMIGASLLVLAASLLPVSGWAQQAERSGEEVVNSVCAACHRTGAHGAPKIGDKRAWAKRAKRGLTSLTQSAIKGIRKMPAHGGNPNLTDNEIALAITYMVNHSGGHWAMPVGEVTSAAERRGKQIVELQCSKCHATGVSGAPKIGDRDAWIARLKQGLDHLVQSAVHGHGPMPPRGGLANLTDSEIRAAIIYMFNPTSASAEEAPAEPAPPPDPNHHVIGNMDVYLGVLPAEVIRERYPEGGPESRMHGGIPSGEGYYHVNITLLDRKTQESITDAKVEARVADPVMGGQTKTLEPMSFNNAASYGNYFRMLSSYPYTISVRIRRPGSKHTVRTQFEFRR